MLDTDVLTITCLLQMGSVSLLTWLAFLVLYNLLLNHCNQQLCFNGCLCTILNDFPLIVKSFCKPTYHIYLSRYLSSVQVT